MISFNNLLQISPYFFDDGQNRQLLRRVPSSFVHEEEETASEATYSDALLIVAAFALTCYLLKCLYNHTQRAQYPNFWNQENSPELTTTQQAYQI